VYFACHVVIVIIGILSMDRIVKMKFLRDGEPVFPHPTTIIINRNSTEEMLKQDISDAIQEAQNSIEQHARFRIVYTDEDGRNEIAIAAAVRHMAAFCLDTALELNFAETEQLESGSHLISLRVDWKNVQRNVSCSVSARLETAFGQRLIVLCPSG
jgi:hypothetical protein